MPMLRSPASVQSVRAFRASSRARIAAGSSQRARARTRASPAKPGERPIRSSLQGIESGADRGRVVPAGEGADEGVAVDAVEGARHLGLLQDPVVVDRDRPGGAGEVVYQRLRQEMAGAEFETSRSCKAPERSE